jgi:hypothetical protein
MHGVRQGRFNTCNPIPKSCYSSLQNYRFNFLADRGEELVAPPSNTAEPTTQISTREVVESPHWDSHLQSETFTDVAISEPVDIGTSISASTYTGSNPVTSPLAWSLPQDSNVVLYVYPYNSTQS